MTIDLTVLRDAKVRNVAKDIAKRVPGIESGLLEATNLGIRTAFTSMRPREELQQLFLMADERGDHETLETLLAAISFSGKKSIANWTTAERRDRVRAAQLYRALHDPPAPAAHGGGQAPGVGPGEEYDRIRQRIARLKTTGAELREMARGELVEYRTPYLDSNKLLRAMDGLGEEQDRHREWYLDQAALMAAYREVRPHDPDTARRLAHIMLNSFSKAAVVMGYSATDWRYQVSPLAHLNAAYHRSTSNQILRLATRAVAERIGWAGFQADGSLQLVHNHTFSEVLARVLRISPRARVATTAEFDGAADDLLQRFRAATPPSFVGIDISRLIVADPEVRSLTDVFPGANSLVAREDPQRLGLEGRFLAKALPVLREAVSDCYGPVRVAFEPEGAEPGPPGPDIKALLGDLGALMSRVVVVGMTRHPLPPPPPPAQRLQAAAADAAAAPAPAAPIEGCDQPAEPPTDVVTPFLEVVLDPGEPGEPGPVDLVLFPPFLGRSRLERWRDTEVDEAVQELLGDGWRASHPDLVAGLDAMVRALPGQEGADPPPPKQTSVERAIDSAIIHTGYRPDPIQTKRIWASMTSPEAVLEAARIPMAELDTRGETVPTVCRDLRALLAEPVVAKFEALATPDAAPYLRILPPATVDLLRGLLDYRFEPAPRVVKLRARIEESAPALRYPGTGTLKSSGAAGESGRRRRFPGPFVDRACETAVGQVTADDLRRGLDLYARGHPGEEFEVALELSDPGGNYRVEPAARVCPFGDPPPADLAGLDKAYWTRGLKDLLQTTYFRIINAMQEAVLRRDDLPQFLNQIELIHQEIAAFLAMLEPHPADAFEVAIRKALAEAPGGPIVTGAPRVHLKPSAMHCMASIAAAVEAMRGTNELKACFLKDCYYEEGWAIEEWRTYRRSTLDGDRLTLNGHSLEDGSLTSATWGDAAPFDLLVCDFHHNISVDRSVYRPERLVTQVELLLARGLVGDRFTIAIDCTIDLICSPDVRDFVRRFQSEIDAGRFNVVLFRSAQKFDMLGLDNYYGGYCISVCDAGAWAAYLRRMDDPADQLEDAPRQGLTHLAKYAAAHLDQYRLGLMANTRRLYDGLPPETIAEAATPGPMQISKIEDPRCVFLDIKFPVPPAPAPEPDGALGAALGAVYKAFGQRLTDFAEKHRLPLTQRASFGFPTSNYTEIGGIKVRLNPGLEGAGIVDRYAAFFRAIHQSVSQGMARHRSWRPGSRPVAEGLAGADYAREIARLLLAARLP